MQIWAAAENARLRIIDCFLSSLPGFSSLVFPYPPINRLGYSLSPPGLGILNWKRPVLHDRLFLASDSEKQRSEGSTNQRMPSHGVPAGEKMIEIYLTGLA
jgi:hypothetical protein